MAYKTRNIIVGAAAVYISVKDSSDSAFYNADGGVAVALPTLTPSQSAVSALEADTANWRHAGLTTDGVEYAYTPDFGEVTVDQMLDSAKMFKQGQTASVNTTFAEATLENLMVVWGQQTASLGTDSGTSQDLNIAGGALGDEPVERSIVFVGPAPRSPSANKKRERLYWVRRALQVEASSHTLSRTDPTTFPASFRVLPDPTASGAEYGKVTDRNIEA